MQEWLSGIGLPEYVALFLRSGYDSINSLKQLNAASIMKIGVRDGEHSMRILNSIRELKGTSLWILRGLIIVNKKIT